MVRHNCPLFQSYLHHSVAEVEMVVQSLNWNWKLPLCSVSHNERWKVWAGAQEEVAVEVLVGQLM